MTLLPIHIDGSEGEGGGQMLRSSLALSILTRTPIHLTNIRAKRPKPGLQAQHLQSVRAAATISSAQVEGDAIASQSLRFAPGDVQAGNYHFAIGTAGATALVLQTIALPLALRGAAASHVVISGGTHVKVSPCFHFLDTTWRAYLELAGLRVKVKLRRPGFYPRGGGVIEATIEPAAEVRPLHVADAVDVKQGEITGFAAPGCHAHMNSYVSHMGGTPRRGVAASLPHAVSG
jgi:RNA 3'-terminal phosphate cyclase (ATP)